MGWPNARAASRKATGVDPIVSMLKPSAPPAAAAAVMLRPSGKLAQHSQRYRAPAIPFHLNRQPWMKIALTSLIMIPSES